MADIRTTTDDDDYSDGWVTPEEITVETILNRPRAHSKAIPIPTYDPSPDLTKKSHARKKPLGHIPRPRNAFILFRCDFVKQGNIPSSVESDHRNISRIVGRVWKAMSKKQKSPWVKMAEVEKANHRRAYPMYRPGMRNHKDKRGDDADGDDEAEVEAGGDRADDWQPTDLSLERALHMALQSYLDSQNQQNPCTDVDGLNKASTSQQDDPDDLPPPPYELNPQEDNPTFFEDIVNQHYLAAEEQRASEECNTVARSIPTTSLVPEDGNSNDVNGMPFGSFIHDIPVNSYPVPDFTVPPDWINMRYDPFLMGLPLDDNNADLVCVPSTSYFECHLLKLYIQLCAPLFSPDAFPPQSSGPSMPTFDPAYLDSISMQALEEQLQITAGEMGEYSNSVPSADFFDNLIFPFPEDSNGEGVNSGTNAFFPSFSDSSLG